jgi:outer membrane protein assembly factor BamB
MKQGLVSWLLVIFITHPCLMVAVEPEPELVISGLGNGYSSPAVSHDRFFITGEKEGIGYLFAYDYLGNELWKTTCGKEWITSYRGSRASPVVIGNQVYTVSGMGEITCHSADNGKRLWKAGMIEDLHGVNAVFGYSMPVTIEGERIYCIPGGPDTNIACLDRFTGKIIWTSAGNGEPPGYVAPLIITHNGLKILIVYSELAMHGLDAETGDLLWTIDLAFKGEVPCNKPVYSEGFLYLVTGPGNGAVKFEISKDGASLKKVWSNIQFDTYFGGFVKIGDYLYGSSQSLRKWTSISAETGKPAGSLSFRVGTTVAADEELVLYNQNGEVAIVKPDRGNMTVLRSFSVTEGTNEHFSHPVIAEGKLFIRHGETLLVYNFRQLLEGWIRGR